MTRLPDARAAAEALVRSRYQAWNRADAEAVRAVLHLPHVSVPGSRLSIRDSERALLGSPDFRALASSEGWHHSTLDHFDGWQTSADKVHCFVAYGRSAADGRRYADGSAVYIATRHDGRWGIQVESGTLRAVGGDDRDDAGAVAAATDVLRRWVEAPDGRTPAAARELVHLPFVELRGPRLLIHRSAAALRRVVREGSPGRAWRRSELGRVEVRECSAQKVTLEAEVVRLGDAGAMIACVPALAIVTELQGRWAIQLHSAF